MGLGAIKLEPDFLVTIDQLLAGVSVSREDIKGLLSLTDVNDIELLFSAARAARKRYFDIDIFLYGFLYFSTYCRNDCCFCQYRSTNIDIPRYRKSEQEILDAAREMEQSGVHLIDLTMGEDPAMFSSGSSKLRRFGDIVMAVRTATELPIMISPGVLPDDILRRLGKAGIDWYACYQETHNRNLFDKLRCGQSFNDRLAKKQLAKRMGMLVEEGLLLGAGAEPDDIVDSLLFMKSQDIDQIRAMSFVPHKGVTIDCVGANCTLQELLTIAVMRLLMPDRLLPASLDVDGLGGLADRLNAGANVVTSIVPPAKGLAGVANQSLDIEEARRTMNKILPIIDSCGLKVASRQTYREWIAHRRKC